MLYAFICEDVVDSLPIRKTCRANHLANVQHLKDTGRLVLAGPHPKADDSNASEAGFSGSLIVAEFPSLQAAKDWINNDPYVTQGVFAKVTVKPFKQVMP
jgi:hypothetical protein